MLVLVGLVYSVVVHQKPLKMGKMVFNLLGLFFYLKTTTLFWLVLFGFGFGFACCVRFAKVREW